MSPYIRFLRLIPGIWPQAFVCRRCGARSRTWIARRSARTVVRAYLVLVVLIGTAACGFAVLKILDARAQLQAAESDLSVAVALVDGGNGLTHASTRGTVVAKFRDAEASFAAAHGDLWAVSPLLAHLGWVPGYGGQLQAAFPVSSAGYDATQGARDLMNGLAPAWRVFAAHRRGSLLVRLAPALAPGRTEFEQARGHLNAALVAVDQAPSNVGSASLNRKLHELRVILPGLSNATRWLAVAPTILGDRHASHILIVWENPDELRATGGFIPAANYVTISRGRITTDPMGSWFNNYVQFPLPAPEAIYTAEVSWLFEDSNWSPDFPLSARYERWMFGLNARLWEPMVIDILGGAADILGATGPLYLPEYQQVVTAQNVAYLIEYYHHHNNATTDTQSQRFLAVLFQAILSHVESMSPKQLLGFGSGVHHAIADQSLLMYDRRNQVESAIEASGAAGKISRPDHDSLFVVDDNLSYNKINPYIDETAQYDVSLDRALSGTATLTLSYHNRPSPRTLFGAGPYLGTEGSKHEYQDFVRIYVPPGSHLEKAGGLDFWAPDQAYGLTQFSGQILIPEGSTARAVFRYQIPRAMFHQTGPRTYLLTIQRQPGGNLHKVVVIVHVAPGMSVGRHGARTQVATLHLNESRTTLRLSISGASASGLPSLPKPSWTADPFIPTSQFNGAGHSF